ncbi:hypothetical protein V1477_001940, partial [Vespula maculifrons]
PHSVGVFLIFRGLEECHRKDPLDEHEERGEERKLSEGREREKEMASLRRSSRRYTRENVLADQVRLKQNILAPPTWHTISVPPQMPHPSHFDEVHPSAWDEREGMMKRGNNCVIQTKDGYGYALLPPQPQPRSIILRPPLRVPSNKEWNGRTTTRLGLATPVSKETDDECRFDGGSSRRRRRKRRRRRGVS